VILKMSMFRDEPVALGVRVACGIGGVLAALGLATAQDRSAPMAYVLPLSLPVGVALAWRHAHAVAESLRFPVARVVVMSLQALVLGSILTGIASAMVGEVAGTSTLTSIADAVGWVGATAFLGILFLGIPMLALIGPTVALWAIAVRRGLS
jgi:hypothetical protein